MKRYLTILMVVWLTLMMSVCSLAAPFDRYSIDDEKQTLTIYGTIEGAKKGDPITIELLNIDTELDSEAEYTGDKIVSDFVLFTQVPAGKNGSYTQVVGMNGRTIGEYTLRVNGKEATKIFYAPASLKEDVLYEIEDACLAMDEEEGIEYLVELIEEEDNSRNIKLLFGATSQYVDEVDSELLAAAIYAMVNNDDSSLATPSTFSLAMDDAISIAALNEGLGNVTDKKDLYGFDDAYVQVYEKELSAEAKAAFAANNYKGKKITTVEGVKAAFNDGVLVAFVDSFDAWSDAQTFIESFGEDIGINMKKYEKLSSKKKAELYQDVINMKADTIEELVKKINKRIDELLNSADDKDKKPSGGGSAGGASASAPITSGKFAGFSDMAGSEWANNAVNELYEKKVVSGIGDNMFAPARTITREEMLTMLLNAYGVDVKGATQSKFTDVPADAWYAPYVAKALELGITSGISETQFGSGKEITREEAAVMSKNIANKFGKTFTVSGVQFTDDASISEWAKTAVYELKGAGVINGIGDGSFAPKATCTRAQAAVIVYALIK